MKYEKEIREAITDCVKRGELPNLTGVCDKQINGKPNFVELLLPDDIEGLLKCPLEHANTR